MMTHDGDETMIGVGGGGSGLVSFFKDFIPPENLDSHNNNINVNSYDCSLNDLTLANKPSNDFGSWIQPSHDDGTAATTTTKCLTLEEYRRLQKDSLLHYIEKRFYSPNNDDDDEEISESDDDYYESEDDMEMVNNEEKSNSDEDEEGEEENARLETQEQSMTQMTERLETQEQQDMMTEMNENSQLETQELQGGMEIEQLATKKAKATGNERQQRRKRRVVPVSLSIHEVKNDLENVDLNTRQFSLDFARVIKIWKLRQTRRMIIDSEERPQMIEIYSGGRMTRLSSFSGIEEDGPMATAFTNVVSLLVEQEEEETTTGQTSKNQKRRRMYVFLYDEYAIEFQKWFEKRFEGKSSEEKKKLVSKSIPILRLQNIPSKCIFPFVAFNPNNNPISIGENQKPIKYCLCLGGKSKLRIVNGGDDNDGNRRTGADTAPSNLFMDNTGLQIRVTNIIYMNKNGTNNDGRMTVDNEANAITTELLLSPTTTTTQGQTIRRRKIKQVVTRNDLEIEWNNLARNRATGGVEGGGGATSLEGASTINNDDFQQLLRPPRRPQQQQQGVSGDDFTNNLNNEQLHNNQGRRRHGNLLLTTTNNNNSNRGGGLGLLPPNDSYANKQYYNTQERGRREQENVLASTPVRVPLLQVEAGQQQHLLPRRGLLDAVADYPGRSHRNVNLTRRGENNNIYGGYGKNAFGGYKYNTLSELRGVYNRYKDTPRAHGGRNSGRVYVNIYATVILFSQHHPTNGTDRTMAISLIDETTCGGDDPVDKPPIILNVFVKNVEDFPQIRQVGDILRMHRVGIDYRGEVLCLTGLKKAGSSFVVIRKDGSAGWSKHSTSKHPTFTADDENRSRVLWDWGQDYIRNHSTIKGDYRTTLADVVNIDIDPGGGHNSDLARNRDFTVMITGIYPTPANIRSNQIPQGFIRVWDGTGNAPSDIWPGAMLAAEPSSDPTQEAVLKVATLVHRLHNLDPDFNAETPLSLCGRVANAFVHEESHWNIVQETLSVGSFVRLRNVRIEYIGTLDHGAIKALSIHPHTWLSPLPNEAFDVKEILAKHACRMGRAEYSQTSGLLPKGLRAGIRRNLHTDLGNGLLEFISKKDGNGTYDGVVQVLEQIRDARRNVCAVIIGDKSTTLKAIVSPVSKRKVAKSIDRSIGWMATIKRVPRGETIYFVLSDIQQINS